MTSAQHDAQAARGGGIPDPAEVFAWVHDRRKARRPVSYPGLSDEDVARYGLDESSRDGVDIGRPSS